MTTSALVTGPFSESGRTRVTARALNRVVAAVSASALGITPDRVGVDAADDHGKLALTVRAPIRMVPLALVNRDHGIVSRSGGSILRRAADAQEVIRQQVFELTGSEIGSVTIRLTSADIRHEERVK